MNAELEIDRTIPREMKLARTVFALLVLLIGRGLACLSCAAAVVAMIAILFLMSRDGAAETAPKLIVPAGLFGFSSWAWRTSVRPLRRLWHETSRGPFVLVLRGFREEGENVHDPEIGPFRTSYSTLIDQLDAHLGKVVRLVALRTPRLRLSRIVAAEVRATNADWKDLVTRLIERSARIVVLATQSESVKWELDTVLTEPHWRKATILIPSIRERDRRWAEHEERWRLVKRYADRLGTPLAVREVELKQGRRGRRARTTTSAGTMPIALTANSNGVLEELRIPRPDEDDPIPPEEYAVLLRAAIPVDVLPRTATAEAGTSLAQ